jgi:hypothetical protein
MHLPHASNTMMNRAILSLAAFTLALSGAAAPAQAQNIRGDQEQARQDMRAGNAMRSRTIADRIVPRYERKGYKYLTFEYDGSASIYRFKFIKDGRVLFVDADPRNGRVLRERR